MTHAQIAAEARKPYAIAITRIESELAKLAAENQILKDHLAYALDRLTDNDCYCCPPDFRHGWANLVAQTLDGMTK